MTTEPTLAEAPRRRIATAVVSGAGGGVGAVVAQRLQHQGVSLVLPARSGQDRLAVAFPGAQVVAADLSDERDCAHVRDVALDTFGGGPDLVAAIAGGFGTGSAFELDADALEKQLSINLRTAVHLITALLPAMRERGRGTILGVSAGASRGAAKLAAYAASKAALEAYLRSLRAEVSEHGLAVTVLTPQGAIDTPANRASMPNADRSGWIAPAAIAEAVVAAASAGPGGRLPEIRVSA